MRSSKRRNGSGIRNRKVSTPGHAPTQGRGNAAATDGDAGAVAHTTDACDGSSPPGTATERAMQARKANVRRKPFVL